MYRLLEKLDNIERLLEQKMEATAYRGRILESDSLDIDYRGQTLASILLGLLAASQGSQVGGCSGLDNAKAVVDAMEHARFDRLKISDAVKSGAKKCVTESSGGKCSLACKAFQEDVYEVSHMQKLTDQMNEFFKSNNIKFNDDWNKFTFGHVESLLSYLEPIFGQKPLYSVQQRADLLGKMQSKQYPVYSDMYRDAMVKYLVFISKKEMKVAKFPGDEGFDLSGLDNYVAYLRKEGINETKLGQFCAIAMAAQVGVTYSSARGNMLNFAYWLGRFRETDKDLTTLGERVDEYYRNKVNRASWGS